MAVNLSDRNRYIGAAFLIAARLTLTLVLLGVLAQLFGIGRPVDLRGISIVATIGVLSLVGAYYFLKDKHIFWQFPLGAIAFAFIAIGLYLTLYNLKDISSNNGVTGIIILIAGISGALLQSLLQKKLIAKGKRKQLRSKSKSTQTEKTTKSNL
jgi:hypothetical protein